MDLQSLYYFQEISKDLHITYTAQRLFLSQQTLSKRLLNMEEELGVQLFERKPSLKLTPAGEKVLEFAKVFTAQYGNLKDYLNDYNRDERGVIRFGASTLRMNTCIGPVLDDFSARYPRVELRLRDNISRNLVPMVLNGELDLAIITSNYDDINLVEDKFMRDDIYLCVTDELLLRHYGAEAAEVKKKAAEYGAHIRDFSRLPFCMHTTKLGKVVRQCFDDERVSNPWVYVESQQVSVATQICYSGHAAGFCSAVNLHDRLGSMPESLNVFPLMYRNDRQGLDLTLIRHKERYQSEYTLYFSDLIYDYFSGVEKIRMERLGNVIAL